MSSSTWTPRAVASRATPRRLSLWRVVEAQHIASTTRLVSNLAEQELLEQILETTKPRLPRDFDGLHYLLATPFRYPPPPGGSRFRGPNDPGVFYAADAVRTACAELGYWRWRHLLDTPALDAMPTLPQTVFGVRLDTAAADLRAEPLVRDRAAWTRPDGYAACQRFARTARAAGVAAIRYESVRDPRRGCCCAVLSPGAFVPPVPFGLQTWLLSVARDRVVWQRADAFHAEEHEFVAAAWVAGAPALPAPARRPRRLRP